MTPVNHRLNDTRIYNITITFFYLHCVILILLGEIIYALLEKIFNIETLFFPPMWIHVHSHV